MGPRCFSAGKSFITFVWAFWGISDLHRIAQRKAMIIYKAFKNISILKAHRRITFNLPNGCVDCGDFCIVSSKCVSANQVSHRFWLNSPHGKYSAGTLRCAVYNYSTKIQGVQLKTVRLKFNAQRVQVNKTGLIKLLTPLPFRSGMSKNQFLGRGSI